MQISRIAPTLILLLCYMLPLSASVVGYSSTLPLWKHLTYPLFHAGALHLIGNCYSLYCVSKTRFLQPFTLYTTAYIIAVIASFFCISNNPTIGASGVVFAIVGMRLCKNATRTSWIIVTSAILIGYLSSAINSNLHLFSFIGGFLAGRVILVIRTIQNDRRTIITR